MGIPGREGGSAGGVATSKFVVPRRRPDVVRRPRLNAFIDAGIGAKGALIAAPAGYGKTTLVVDWHETSDFAMVWLSLDSWDADLAGFARALADAIAARFPIEVALGDQRFWQPRTISTVLINAIAAQDDYVVLVLDDVHTVESAPEVMETLGYLLERAPENLYIVMTSRTRPPVPSLSRLMARREVMTIGAGDLAFTPREVRELLASLGRAVSDDEAEALYERTEGWAAALILGAGPTALGGTREAAVSGAESPGRISGPNVGLSLADYAQGEALTSVPDDLRAFLRTISLLPVWTPSLCNDMTGRRDGERMLKDAAARVLFLTQHSDEPPMYRCHQLMRALLMQQYRTEDPAGFAEAGRSTAETLTRFGMLNEAVDLLFELEEWDLAGATLEQIAPRLMQQGQARGLAEWIDRLPSSAQAQRPHLQVWRARAAMKQREFDDALRRVDDALRALRASPETDIRGLVQALFVRGETLRMKGYNDEALATFGEARTLLETTEEGDTRLTGAALRNIGVTHTLNGDLDAAIDELEEARRLLEQVGDLQGIGDTCGSLAMCYSRRGEPHQALGALQRAQSAYERSGNTFDLGMTLNNTGMVYYELGEFDQALQVYDRGVRLMRGTGNVQDEAFMLAGIAETYRSLGRFDESLATYQEVEPLAAGLQMPYLTIEITEGLALTRLGLGQGEDAAQLLRSVAPKPADPPARISQHALAEAQILLEKGDPAAALKRLDLAARHFEAAENRQQLALASFLKARALFEGHHPRKAMAEIERVSALCEKLGYRRFLRPHAVRAKDMLEYAAVRHVADALLSDVAAETVEHVRASSLESRERLPSTDMLPQVRAFGFGRGSVLVAERQVSDLEWRSEKSKEMFFFLLLARGAVAKEEIFGALWPDLPESKCNSNFHSSLYRLRRALFHECVVREPGGGYTLNPRGIFASDVDAFNLAMLEAELAKDEAARATKLEEALGLYKGAFLSSTYSEWIEPLRRELEGRYIEVLNELAARKLRDGVFEDALSLFKALEALDPYSEAAAYGIMRSLLSLNDGGAAARHYRRFRQLLKDELDEDPSERLNELYREASARG